MTNFKKVNSVNFGQSETKNNLKKNLDPYLTRSM